MAFSEPESEAWETQQKWARLRAPWNWRLPASGESPENRKKIRRASKIRMSAVCVDFLRALATRVDLISFHFEILFQ